MCPLFVGEASGARVVQTAVGLTDVTPDATTDVMFDATTHPAFPAGGGGLALFRQIDVEIRHNAGYQIGITPIVDGVSLLEQTFSSPPPMSGGQVIERAKAFFVAKGTAVAARVRMLAATGTVELADMAVSYVTLRAAP